VAAARMDWVMSPSSGDALLCFVKRTVPAGSKGTNWYRQDYTQHKVVVKELCQHCHGKGEVSTACRGCKGKGIVLDEKRTRLHGTPVYKICGRCNGNRFSRLPTTLARNHVQKLVPDLTDYQWYKGYADVIDKLVTKCWQEEAYAETQLRKVTR
ncbi:antitermination protein, partial [Escherichia coli]